MLVRGVIAIRARGGDIDFGRSGRLGAPTLGRLDDHGKTLTSGRGDAFSRAVAVQGFVSSRRLRAKDVHVGEG